MGNTISTAFGDPAKYDLYDCKQLETERKNLATRGAELQGLMAKADTGVAGPGGCGPAPSHQKRRGRGRGRVCRGGLRRNKSPAPPPLGPPRPPPAGPYPPPPPPASRPR